MRSAIPRKSLGDLTCNPLRRRVGCDADPDVISAIKQDDDEAIQQLKANGRHYEQIHGGDVRRVVSQKGPPFLTWRPASLDHILGDTAPANRAGIIPRESLHSARFHTARVICDRNWAVDAMSGLSAIATEPGTSLIGDIKRLA